MKIHELKIWPEHIEALAAGTKTFEIRSTADHTFEVGDILCLNEYDPADRLYSGRQIRASVVGVHTGLGVAPGFAILSLAGITKVGGWVEGRGEPPELKLPGSGPELAAKIQEIQEGAKKLSKLKKANEYHYELPEKRFFSLDEVVFGRKSLIEVQAAAENEFIRTTLIDLGWVPPGEIVPDNPAQLTINEIAEVITRPIHLAEFRISHPRAMDIALNIAEAANEKAERLAAAGIKS